MITLRHRPWARNAASSVLVIAVTGGAMAATASVQDLLGRLHSAQHALAVANEHTTAPPGSSPSVRAPAPSSAAAGSARAEPLPYEVVPTAVALPVTVPVADTGPAATPTAPASSVSPTPNPSPTPRPTPTPGPTSGPTPTPPAAACTVRLGVLTIAACIDIPLGESSR